MSTDVYYPYALLPHAVGRPADFDFSEPDVLVECPPNGYLKARYTRADPYETVINNCPQMSESSTNTDKIITEDRGQNHSEGGWPTSVDIAEPEERNRYARRMCRDIDVALKKVVPQVSTCLRMNGALDIYEPLFDEKAKLRYTVINKKLEAIEEERSKQLCPWRHEPDSGAASMRNVIKGLSSKDPNSIDTIASAGGNAAILSSSAFTVDSSAATNGPSVNILGAVDPMNAASSGATSTNAPRQMSDIAYSDPNVVHALHVSCKLSIPNVEQDKYSVIHGTTASQSRYACGSDSTRLVVGYCEGILPAGRIEVSKFASVFASVRGVGGAASRDFGSTRSPLFDGTRSQSGVGIGGLNFLSSTPSPASARRSTAVSPHIRQGAGPSFASSVKSTSKASTTGGDNKNSDDDDDDDDDRDLAITIDNSKSAAFILKHDAERKRRALEKGGSKALEALEGEYGIIVDDVDEDDDDDDDHGKKNNAANQLDVAKLSVSEATAKSNLLNDAQRATANNLLKRQLSSLGGAGGKLGGTMSLAPMNPTPQGEWGVSGAMWSTTDPSAHTNVFLSSNGGATSIVASYRDPNLVHGGVSSGMLEVWDVRQGAKPVMASGRDHSHRDAVTAVKLVTTKASECFSAGLDGQVLFWDTRRLETPIFEESVQLKCPITGTRFAATGIDFDPLVGGTLKYLVSTIEGKVVSVGRRANKHGDKILSVVDAHYGACFQAMRCPSVPKIFATCGDWGFRLMGDDLNKSSAIYNSPLFASNVLCGIWHPTRHSIFIVGTSAGDVHFHDLLRTSHGAVMKIRASSCAIRHLEAHVTGRTIAATDAHGEVHIIALPSVLYEPCLDEKAHLVSLLEREYARERISEGVESNAFNHGFGGITSSSQQQQQLHHQMAHNTANAIAASASPLRGGRQQQQRRGSTSSATGYSSPTAANLASAGGTNMASNGPRRVSIPTTTAPPAAGDEAEPKDEEEPKPLLVDLVSTQIRAERDVLRRQERKKRLAEKRRQERKQRFGDSYSESDGDDDEGVDEDEDIDDDGNDSEHELGGTQNMGKYTPAASPHLGAQHLQFTAPETFASKGVVINDSQREQQQQRDLPPPSLAQTYLSLLGVPSASNPYAPLLPPPIDETDAKSTHHRRGTTAATTVNDEAAALSTQKRRSTVGADSNASGRGGGSGLFSRLKSAASAQQPAASASSAAPSHHGGAAAAPVTTAAALLHNTNSAPANGTTNSTAALDDEKKASEGTLATPAVVGGGAVAASPAAMATDAASAHQKMRERRGTRVGQRPTIAGGSISFLSSTIGATSVASDAGGAAAAAAAGADDNSATGGVS